MRSDSGHDTGRRAPRPPRRVRAARQSHGWRRIIRQVSGRRRSGLRERGGCRGWLLATITVFELRQGGVDARKHDFFRVADEALAHDGEGDRTREEVCPATETAREEPPEELPASAENAEVPHRAPERPERPVADAVRDGTAPERHRVQVQRAAPVIRVGGIQRREKTAVSREQRPLVERGHEVGTLEGVPGRCAAQAPFPVEPPPELRPRERRQQVHHGARDGEAGDERELPIEDVRAVAVEADDEPGVNLEPGAGQLLDRALLGHAQVLGLLGLGEGLEGGRLDPDEDLTKPGLNHRCDELGMRREVDAALGAKDEREPVPLLPGAQHRQERRDRAAVADEVVVDEEQRAAGSQGEKRVELRHHLLRRLHPRHPPEDLDDVAELAVERAPARILQRVAGVPRELQEVEPRHSGEPQVGTLFAPGERRRGASGVGASSTRTSRSSRPSASPWNTWSASSKSSGAVLGAGPPTTVRRPFARARRSTPRIDSSWMSMPETRTTSAHARSASSSGATWRSRRRSSQRGGRSAASVAIPSGGYVAAFPTKGSACSKLQ